MPAQTVQTPGPGSRYFVLKQCLPTVAAHQHIPRHSDIGMPTGSCHEGERYARSLPFLLQGFTLAQILHKRMELSLVLAYRLSYRCGDDTFLGTTP
jgi:hypothetical protein